MAAIKPNEYPIISEFKYKPQNYESQKNTLKSYKKEIRFTLEKRSQRKYLPSTNHGQSPTKSKQRTKLSSAMEQTGIDQSPWLSENW